MEYTIAFRKSENVSTNTECPPPRMPGRCECMDPDCDYGRGYLDGWQEGEAGAKRV